ncbi:MAG: hypothetical protein H0S80_13965 [Desulfovibrionaceae bacterium]|nr:hypothetical protein [Desulfovibrionaceae bacterium]
MTDNIHRIEESILRMTAVVRQEQAELTAKSFGEIPDPKLRPRGWWVLACGEPLDEESFDSRETARERLLAATRLAGLVLPENIWVWDEAGMAQLVVSTVPTLERARTLADRLRKKGLVIRIKRETF